MVLKEILITLMMIVSVSPSTLSQEQITGMNNVYNITETEYSSSVIDDFGVMKEYYTVSSNPTFYNANSFVVANVLFDNSDVCEREELKNASYVCVNKITEEGLEDLQKNGNLKYLSINDVSNLDLQELSKLYDYICKDNIELSTILLAYENLKDSYGNDGTDAYQHAVKTYCDNIVVKRSCASVVSTALNAAGYVDDYASAGCSGLVNYFNTHPDEWVNMGVLTESEMQCGDVIFIDRQGLLNNTNIQQSETSDYGAIMTREEAEALLEDYFDNVSTESAEWTLNHIFYPDSDYNGEIDEEEADYWYRYWMWHTGSVPDYSFYDQWVANAEVFKEQKIREFMGESPESIVKSLNGGEQVVTNGIIHNHIFMWLGNDVVQKYYPDSKGNIVSGSYTENYSQARSAAISRYNFTENYTVFRHIDKAH